MNIVLPLSIAVILRSRVPDLTMRDLRSWLLDPWWVQDAAAAGPGRRRLPLVQSGRSGRMVRLRGPRPRSLEAKPPVRS